MQKNTLLTVLAITVLGGSMLLASPAYAATNNSSWQDHWDTMIEKMAAKFNLKKDDVKKVFDEVKSEQKKTRETEREKQFESMLTQAVKDGKITEDQKYKILAKHKELVGQKGTKRQEMQAWAKENNIDVRWLMGMGPGGGRGRERGLGY